MNPKYLLIISLFFYFFNFSVLAEKTHGIAMHGKPKYDEGFTHLDYVNPNAPKGGVVRFGAYGSFDNLNRVLASSIPARFLISGQFISSSGNSTNFC